VSKTLTAQDQSLRAAPLHPTVRALGIVSLLNDLSSEVAVRTLPLFLANVLGVRASIIGLIEGIAESTATLLKLVSGHISDRIGKKKVLTLWGYGLSNLTKPLLYFAGSWTIILLVRFLDRVGKGVRTAPRDALIADVTLTGNRGRAFGFNRATVLYATERDAVTLTWETYQWLVLLAVVPGLAAVAIIAKWVEDHPTAPVKVSARLLWSEMGGRFWSFIAIVTVFTLGNSSDAFLMLRAQTVGLTLLEIFLVIAVFNLVISATSTKGGALSDRFGRRNLIVVGWLIYAAIYLGLAYASSGWHMWALYAGYGLYYGAFQGASSALIADLVPQHLRGTAYGIFNGALGVAAFPASLIAGILWDWYGPAAPFLFGSGVSLLAIIGLFVLPKESTQGEQ
jgi:MFS family permease